jgi:DUF4097 and DUF4098 domain-containing protein YvlB
VQVTDVDADLDVQTTSAPVTATWTLTTSHAVAVRTTSGPVGVRLPADASVDLQASTATGALRSTFPVETTRTGMTWRVGGGGAHLTLRTTSGRITVDPATS